MIITPQKGLLSLRARFSFAFAAAGSLVACSSDTTTPADMTTAVTSGTTSSPTSATTSAPSPSTTQPSSSSGPSSTSTAPSVTPTSSPTATAPTTSPATSETATSETSTTSSDAQESSEASSDTGAASTSGEASTSEGESSNGEGSSLSAGCGKAPSIAANMYNNGNPIAITAANRQRRYILSVPNNYDNTKPHNLVIAWHQLDGNDKQMYQQEYYWLRAIPEAASSTIFVAPNGERQGTPCTGNGNGEGGCGWPDSNGSNVALADAVVAQIEENFCIDKNRIFANGWSYGGSMSYRTACSRPLDGEGTWGVRGVAVYNGAAQLSSGGCNPSKKVAFYASHGTNDGVLGYDGGVSMANTFARVNGCTWMTPTRATGNHVCTQVAGCSEGYPVEFCSFVGDHTPDPRDGGQRWQPQEVWRFFSQL